MVSSRGGLGGKRATMFTQVVTYMNLRWIESRVLSLFTYVLYGGNRGINLTSFSSISHCSNSENWPQ